MFVMYNLYIPYVDVVNILTLFLLFPSPPSIGRFLSPLRKICFPIFYYLSFLLLFTYNLGL